MKTKLTRIISLITILCMLLSMVACSDKVRDKTEETNETEKTTISDLSEHTNSTESTKDTTDPEGSPEDLATPESSTKDESAVSDGDDSSPDVFTEDVIEDGAYKSESFVGSLDSSMVEGTEGFIPETDYSSDDSDGILPMPDEPDVDYPIEQPQISSGTLTAGEWNDNENYDFLLKLISDQGTYSNYVNDWNLKLIKKLDVKVTASNGPADNICVTLTDDDNNIVATTFTDKNGMAYIYVNPFISKNSKNAPSKCNVTVGNETKSIELNATSYTQLNEFTFDIEADKVTKLDLCFMVDTTGSMSDELLYLQAELEDVIKKVNSEHKDVDIRLSVNFYRDEGDEYVTKTYDFSSDIEDMIKKLNEQECNGGGDYEEAVHTALEVTVNDLTWREDATKLMFFVLDAPAHRENADVITSLEKSITTATEKGIRIIPIASSGVDKHTEFMLRGFAAITNGTYTFLTDHSGVGESHIEPSIGEYEVLKLNELLVKLIGDRI